MTNTNYRKIRKWLNRLWIGVGVLMLIGLIVVDEQTRRSVEGMVSLYGYGMVGIVIANVVLKRLEAKTAGKAKQIGNVLTGLWLVVWLFFEFATRSVEVLSQKGMRIAIGFMIFSLAVSVIIKVTERREAVKE